MLGILDRTLILPTRSLQRRVIEKDFCVSTSIALQHRPLEYKLT